MRNYEALIVFNMKGTETPVEELISTCLLYTSDAADE